ncbi:hypothetical protein QFZ82_001713 [Streptomyces sp. V4I23]|uniref:hypothetical protein n=1 Tax=Streptomyces sp. V4I23 TaxID=3042282 RepID=UPI002788ED6D|nr:hypothetical protein [Streptomyces sp. V4I23]MDQ1007228.1 hypothetical protein [Streptomyces sp. V4I23]
MTATAPSGGTSESQPGGDGGTPAEPTGPSEDSGGSPSAGPARLPRQQSAAGAGSEPREGLWSIVADTLGLTPGSSPRRRVVTLLVMVSIALVAVFRDALVDYGMTEWNVTRQNDSNKEYDASQQPFTVSVQPEQGEPREWAMVLDRVLTADEVRKMTSPRDSSATFSYLKSLGGHPLAYAPLLEHAPKRYTREQMSTGRLELSDTFKMIVLSTRSSPVVIDNWKVTDVTCRKSTAQTVVAFPPQGGVAYQGIRLHLPPRADEPVLTDDTEGQGEPYFGTRYIEVGGGQPSGGIRAEVIAPPGQSCQWGIKVHYNDSYVKEGRWVQLEDRKGRPLRIRTESAPENPRQSWVSGAVPWTPCHEKPEEPMCDLL